MKNWNLIQLSDVCHTKSGGTPSRTKLEYFGGIIPWVKSGDLTDGLVTTTDESLTELGLQNSSAKIFEKGTVLVAMYGATVGKLGILNLDATTNQAVCGISPSKDLNRDFLFYFLLSKRRDLIAKSTGGAQPNISQRILRELKIPLPSISEQLHIVNILSHSESIVRLRREAQEKTAKIIPSLFVDLFGEPATNSKAWPTISIGKVIISADYGSSTKASESGEGIPIIRMGNVDYAGHLKLDDLKYVELSTEEKIRFGLLEGDIIFNRTNSKDLVGKTGLWDGSIDAVVASYFIRIRVKREIINPFFFWAFMNSAYMKRVLFDTSRGAIGQANINAKELRAFQIMVPPIAKQNIYESRCRDIFSIQAQQAVATHKAEAAFAALLSQIFTTNGKHAAA